MELSLIWFMGFTCTGAGFILAEFLTRRKFNNFLNKLFTELSNQELQNLKREIEKGAKVG